MALIVLEGIDGSGKSTLSRGLAEALESRGFRVVQTREPTDGPIGKQIRALAASGRGAVTPEQEFQLFHEDRRSHVAAVVRPALKRGDVVIQDRSYFSTVAYQGQRGLDRARLLAESEAIAPKPDVLFVIDLPVDDAMERIRASRRFSDDFESKATLEEVRRAFLAFDGAIILDGTQTAEEVLRSALPHVISRLDLGLAPLDTAPQCPK
jgi:dTMP kinase